MKRIVLTGYFGYGNCGDEAMLAGALAWLRGRDDHPGCLALSRHPERTRREHDCEAELALPTGPFFMPRLLARPPRWRTLDRLRRADAVLWLAGSGVFSDTRGPILDRLWPVLALLRRLTPRLGLISASAGPLVDSRSLELTRRATSICDAVGARDPVSLALLQELTDPARRHRLIPMADAACWLQPPLASQIDALVRRLAIAAPERCLGICIPQFMATARLVPRHEEYQEQFLGALAEAVGAAAQAHGLTPLLIPFQSGVDEPMAQALSRRIRIPHQVLGEVLGPASMLGLLGRLRLVIGMRLHSLILSALAGTPVIGIVYDEKVRSFLEDIGQGQRGIDYKIWEPERPPLDARRLRELIDATLEEQATVRRDLAETVAALRRRNEQAAARLIELGF